MSAQLTRLLERYQTGTISGTYYRRVKLVVLRGKQNRIKL